MSFPARIAGKLLLSSAFHLLGASCSPLTLCVGNIDLVHMIERIVFFDWTSAALCFRVNASFLRCSSGIV